MRMRRLLRDGVTAFALLFFIWLIALKLQQGNARIVAGPFIAIDGDTLARDGERYRLTGIDAPERSQTCGAEEQTWPCGDAARMRLAELIAGGAECRGDRHDRYGRLLVSCASGGTDPAAWLVEEGLAVSDGAYDRQQAEARASRRGLWGGDFEHPADWRRRHDAARQGGGLLQWLFGGKEHDS